MSCLDDPDYDPWMCGNDSEPEGSLEDPGFLLPFDEEEEPTAFRNLDAPGDTSPAESSTPCKELISSCAPSPLTSSTSTSTSPTSSLTQVPQTPLSTKRMREPTAAASDTSARPVHLHKRRRIDSKTKPTRDMPEPYRQAPGPEPEVPGLTVAPDLASIYDEYQPEADDREDFLSQAQWSLVQWNVRMKRIHESVRLFWMKRLVRFHTNDEVATEIERSGRNGGRRFRGFFCQIGVIRQRHAALRWIIASKAPEWIRLACDAIFTGQDRVPGAARYNCKSCLLTWIGPWTAEVTGEFTTTPGRTQTPLDVITRELTAAVESVDLWEKMQSHGTWVAMRAGAQDWAMCMEVCPETYHLQGVIRLHLHVFLKGMNNLRLGALSDLALDGAVPVTARTVGGLTAQGSATHRASWSGYFYVVAPKKGQVFALANKRPWKDFLVNPTWIMNLLQADKLSFLQARALLCRCSSGVMRNLQELKAIEEEKERLLIDAKEADALASFRAYRRSFKTYDVVDAFLAQFLEDMPRYKFLVLNGPSRLGKTLFARSLAKCDEGLLEVNCSAGNEPDLRAYRLSKHDTILFDEISPRQVASQRKLFQGAAAPVALGTSATNCHSYRVLVYRTKMVLATNVWDEELPLLSPVDQDWIMKNSFILRLTERMWKAEGDNDDKLTAVKNDS